MTFPLNLYSINSILPHLSLIVKISFYFTGVYISSGFSFLFFYPLKLVTGFANVTSFKLKNHDSLFDFKNTFKFIYGDHSLSHMTHLLSFLLFIHFFHIEYPLLIETSLLRTYVFFFYYYYLFLFTGVHMGSAATQFSSMISDYARFYVQWWFQRHPWNCVPVMISDSAAV
jgi:hypothetical protein